MASEDVLIRVGSRTEAAVAGIQSMGANIATSVAQIGAQFDRVATLVTGQANRIVGAFEGQVEVFADYDQAMQNVRSIAKGTNEEFSEMDDLAVELASTMPTTSKKIADGYFQLASAGLEATEIMEVTPAIMNLAAASATDFETAANGVTSAIFAYQLEMEDANMVTEVFQNANTRFKTTMPELADSMRFAGSAAAALGLSVSETAAHIGLARNVGLEASQAGTGLRQVYLSLAGPTGAAAEAMEKYGFQVAQTEDGSLDIQRTFQNLRATLDTIPDPLEQAAFMTDVFSKRGFVAAQAMVNHADSLDELATSLEEEGTVAAAVAVQNEGLRNKMLILNGAIEEQEKALGEKLAPAQLKVLELKNNMLDLVNRLPAPFVEWGGGALFVAASLAKMVLPIVSSIIQIALLIATLRIQSAVQMQATGSTVAHTTATGGYTIAQLAANLALMLFPAMIIVLAIAALILAIVLLVKNWDKVSEVMTNLWGFIADTFIAAWEGLISLFNRVKTTLMENIDMVLLIISIWLPFIGIPILIYRHWGAITEFFSNLFSTITEIFTGFISTVTGAVAEFATTVVGFYIDMWTTIIGGVVDFFANFFDIVRDAFNGVIDAVLSFKDSFIDTIANGLSTVMNSVLDFAQNFIGTILDALPGQAAAAAKEFSDTLFDTIQAGLDDVIFGLADFASRFLDIVIGFVADIGNHFINFAERVWTVFADLFMTVFGIVSGWVVDVTTAIAGWAAEVFGIISGWILDVVSAIVGWVDQTAAIFIGWATSLLVTVRDFIGDLLGRFARFASGVILSFTGLVADVTAAVAGWVLDVTATVVEFLGGLLEAVVTWTADVLTAFVDWAAGILEVVLGWVVDVTAPIVGFFGDILASLAEWGASFVTGVAGFLADIVTGIVQWGVDLLVTVVTTFDEILANIFSMMTSLIEGGFGDIPGKFAEIFGGIISDALEWGKEIVGNIAQGILDNTGPIGDAAGGVADFVTSGLGFLSPTNPAMQALGAGLGENVGIGLGGSAKNLEDAATRAFGGITAGVPAGAGAAAVAGAAAPGINVTGNTFQFLEANEDSARLFMRIISDELARTGQTELRG